MPTRLSVSNATSTGFVATLVAHDWNAAWSPSSMGPTASPPEVVTVMLYLATTVLRSDEEVTEPNPVAAPNPALTSSVAVDTLVMTVLLMYALTVTEPPTVQVDTKYGS